MIENWRTIAVIVILVLLIIDLGLTYYYVNKYKQWQPDKPYKLIELNPLLVYLWNQFGLKLGMFIGAVFLLALNYIVVRGAHWSIVLILFGVLVFIMFNHFNNTTLLFKLIEMYPDGHLPVETFGEVMGNNKIQNGG